MSRRKQSNPKPIKRQSEDSLESIATLLRLPLDVFSVRDPQDDVHEYTLYTNRRLKSGFTFGPYQGKLVSGEDHDGLHVIETKGENGEEVQFALTDESGGWLKLLRPAQSSNDHHNASFFHNGSVAWCTITMDLEPDTELFVRHRWAGDVTSPNDSAHNSLRTCDRFRRGKVETRRTPEYRVSEEERNDSDTDHVSQRSPNVYCDMFNGLTVDSMVKCEPSSPATPPSTSSIPSEDCRNTEDAPAYLNGSNYAPAFPCGGTTATSTTEGPLRCDQCETFFNSRRILNVHQSYYCQGKPGTLSSDTDTEDATSVVKTEPNPTHSPVASENDGASSPPKDLASIPSEDALSPNSSAKRRRAVSLNDVPPLSKPGRMFRCQYCSYSTDKKASLTRHVRMHGGAGRTSDGPPVATPPMARYCANCDIQFASYKNYMVHKEFYCNTRHVHKSVTSSSPNACQQQQHQQQQQKSQQQQQPTVVSQQPLQNSSQSHSPRNLASPSSEAGSAKPGYNMVLNQPLYAAISTSPLILVPCSYVAGAGGLSPGLIPAGNIVIPNPQSSSPDPQKSVIPTFTVMPESGTASNSNEEAASPSKPESKATKVPAKESPAAKLSKVEVRAKSPGGSKEESAEQPLDLSFRKKESERSKQISPHLPSDSGSRRSASPPSEDANVPPSLPIMPMLSADQLLSRDTGSAPILAPPVLVKQGANKCLDCNIVFYKHENYLVHKSKYCAGRAGTKSRDSESPEKSRDGTELSDKEEAGKTNQKSPISSPRVSNSRTPPATDSDPCETTPLAPVVQYYCMACGIKYTSLDNLRAHQFYYCPKREMQPMALVPSYPSLQHSATRTSSSSSGADFKCSKCKNAYPTEELLRQHPCVVQRKCPYCDVYCPTLSAAQRHLVTHTGIKSFRCSLCGYKGHTLRGMRTHIRIHLDKNNSTPEEAYILCMDEGGTEIGCAGRKSAAMRVNSERIKSVISTEPPHAEVVMPVSPVSAPPPSILPTDILAIKAVPDDPVATGDTTHWCQICGYSSSYKGNVVRHVKLVHKDLVSTQAMSNIVNSRPSAESLLKQGEAIEHPVRVASQEAILSTSVTDHSNSSSSLDVKPVVNGLVNKTDPVLRLEEKPLMLKAETSSPPPPATTAAGSSSKGVKRPLSEDGQCLQGAFTSKSGPKYCKYCDISFNFLSNFLAHKKFYCTPRQVEVSAQESTSVQPVQ